MDIITGLFSFIIHIDVYLGEIIKNYGILSYAVLFLIIFVETGLVFIPFLPGDSLLFAAGAFASAGSFNIFLLIALLWVAAILGDSLNYFIGRFFGQKIIDHPKIPINQEHYQKAHAFYEKYGGKTIFLARFIPIIRTFAPFIAGMGKMDYKNFSYYNIMGGFVWVTGITAVGYLFGDIEIVRNNFSLVILAIIAISILPVIIEFVKHKFFK